MNDVGIIAIGRNEGDRLRLCLQSALASGPIVIYVDSASTDGSAEMAEKMGAHVVHLDMSIPFSAARARNEGFALLLKLSPDVRLVQFLDGDCELLPGWIEKARQTLLENAASSPSPELKLTRTFNASASADANAASETGSQLVNQLAATPFSSSAPSQTSAKADPTAASASPAAVCGRRRERFPQRSIYNRVADIEWNTPIGPAKSCGGDAMFRVDAFKSAGGYDPTVVAGEEPELCQRLRAAGWSILRIDAEMTLHDSAMLKFSQWWKRSVRSGYGAMDVASRFGQAGLFVGQVRSARLWVYGWPIALIASGAVGAVFGPRGGLALMFLVTLALPLQTLRTARGIRRRATSWPDALAYGALTMLSKWANVTGQRQWAKDRAAGRYARMIEYKTPSPKRDDALPA